MQRKESKEYSNAKQKQMLSKVKVKVKVKWILKHVFCKH